MKNLRQHWRALTCVLAALVLVGAFWMRSGVSRSVAAQAPMYTAVTAAERQAVLHLMAEIDLDRDALIALNLTAADAESLVSTVRTWRENNIAAMSGKMNTVHEKAAAVRDLELATQKGPFDESRAAALAVAHQELADARTAYRTALTPLESQVNGVLSAAGQATWSAVKGGFDHAMPLRILSLSADQKKTLARAERHYRLRMASARTEQERASAISARQAVREQTLTVDQLQKISDYQSSLADASRAVVDALDVVLPPAGG